MSRLARIALLVALVAGLALPRPAAGAPPDHEQNGIAAATHDLLARLWEPFLRLFGASDAQGGPISDPDGFAGPGHGAAPPPNSSETTGNTESDGGPVSDPNG
jgi:hypothetical protein